MTMAVDNQQRHPMGGSMGYDQMHYPQPAAPQFNNPWTSAPPQAGYQSSVPPTSGMNYDYKHPVQKPTSIPMPYSSMPSSTPTSYPTAYSQPEMMSATTHAPYDSGYTTAPPHPSSYAPSSSSYPAPMSSYAQSLAAQQQEQQGRRMSSTSSHASSIPQSHSSFGDAIEASRGMVAMAHNDVTPRNIYGRQDHRPSIDSYGFPGQHSTNSSISSASGYGGHYGYAGSIDGSATDYSSASESVDGMSHSRTLPRPNAMLPGGVALSSVAAGHLPPAPASMMGSFNSKVSSSAQKKHKCKICDKRFTRPSSLQTHMYSHTGEKPFQCEVPGCGRNFSVVSNLRRHRKVHKNDGTSGQSKDDDKDNDDDDNEQDADQGSPDSSWTSGRD